MPQQMWDRLYGERQKHGGFDCCAALTGGMVDRPLVLSMDELAKLPTITIACTLVRAARQLSGMSQTDPELQTPAH
jgi:hypothetical protein